MIENILSKLLVIGGVALTLNSHVNADNVNFDFNSQEAVTALNGSMASDNPTFTSMGDTDTVILSVDALLPIPASRFVQPTTLRVQTLGPGLSVISADDSDDNFFDGSEAATFSFNTAVIVREFDLFDLGSGEVAQVVVDGNPTPFTFTDAPGDVFSNPFGAGTVIAAGTGITFSISASAETTEFGLQRITVDTVSAVPEPSSLAIIGLGSLLMMTRRRR